MQIQYNYLYNKNKSEKLKIERKISFEDVIAWIEAGQVIKIITHPNQQKYPSQEIYIIEHNNYIYLVPFERKEETIILKTIFPSRKATKFFLNRKAMGDINAKET